MKTGLLAATALAISLSAGALSAQPGPGPGPHDPEHMGPHHEKRMRHFEEELNLTEEQKAKLNDIREKRRKARDAHVVKMKKVRDKMKTELAKEKPDGKKLMAYATQTADLVEEMTKERIDHLLTIKKVLNKEQFEKLLSHELHERKKGKGCNEPGCHHKGGRKHPNRKSGPQEPQDE